jgi:hypothetical protein
MIRTSNAGCLIVAIAMGLALIGPAGCGDSSSSGSRYPNAGPLRVTGGGSGQFRRAGTIGNEGYGYEASRAELKQAAEDVHDYLAAYAEEDWEMACAFLSRRYANRLKEEAMRSAQTAGDSCAAMIDAYTAPIARGERTRRSEVVAGSLRIKGDTGYLFFNPAGAGEKFLMLRENGAWRIAENLWPTPAN